MDIPHQTSLSEILDVAIRSRKDRHAGTPPQYAVVIARNPAV